MSPIPPGCGAAAGRAAAGLRPGIGATALKPGAFVALRLRLTLRRQAPSLPPWGHPWLDRAASAVLPLRTSCQALFLASVEALETPIATNPVGTTAPPLLRSEVQHGRVPRLRPHGPTDGASLRVFAEGVTHPPPALSLWGLRSEGAWITPPRKIIEGPLIPPFLFNDLRTAPGTRLCPGSGTPICPGFIH
jgi:hypothetical protein